MTYLALDQSPRKIGWALGDIGVKPRFGVHSLPQVGDDHSPFLVEARNWLEQRIIQDNVHLVCFESPFLGPDTNPIIIRKIYALVGVIELTCHDRQVPCKEVMIHTWRKHFLGYSQTPREVKGAAKRRRFIKDAAMRACVERDWFVQSDDAADACGILDYVMSCDDPNYAIETSPLFKGAA